MKQRKPDKCVVITVFKLASQVGFTTNSRLSLPKMKLRKISFSLSYFKELAKACLDFLSHDVKTQLSEILLIIFSQSANNPMKLFFRWTQKKTFVYWRAGCVRKKLVDTIGHYLFEFERRNLKQNNF